MNSVLDLANLIQGFKFSCQTEGKSPKTIDWYNDFLNGFRKYLNFKGFPIDLKQINRNHIRAYIAYLQNEARTSRGAKPFAPATIQGAVRTLKAFFSWALREEYIESNPMTKIPVPKATYKIVNTYTQEQITNLISLCNKSDDSGCRNLAILLLLLDTGIRVSELVGIDLNDVNLTEGYIKIRHAKGGKERLIPIGSLVQKSLWRYINRYRPKPLTQKVTRLFLSNHGVPLARSGVQQMIRRYGKRANIDGVRCSPHTFRRPLSKLLAVMVGLSLLFWSGYITYSETSFVNGALSTTGTYVDFRQAGLESSRIIMTIEYEAEGQTWRITEGSGSSRLVGKEVEVFYQPGNPHEGRTDQTRADAGLSTLIVGVLVSVLLWKIVRFGPTAAKTTREVPPTE